MDLEMKPIRLAAEHETKTPIVSVVERGTKTFVSTTIEEDARTSDEDSADADPQAPIISSDDLRLRRVAGKIPYTAYAVTVLELAQTLSLSGTLVVSEFSSFLRRH